MNPTLIRTTAEKNRILQELANLKSNSGKLSDNWQAQVKPLTAAVLELDANVMPTSEELDKTVQTLNQLPIVQVTLAILPTSEQIDEISGWSRRHLHPQVLLEVIYNTQLIAGIQINWRGVFFDGSMRKRAGENMKQQVAG